MSAVADQQESQRITATIESHPANSFVHDERVQRGVRQARVREIARKLDLRAIGVVTVSERPDGDRVLLDGQHRVLALIARGLGDHRVTCKVFKGLARSEEAGLFRRLNNTSRTTAIEDLLKGIVEGDDESVAIAAIARRFGLRISTSNGDGQIACAQALRTAYRSGDAGVGPASLGFALHVATAAWGTYSDSVDGIIVGGLAVFYQHFGEEINRGVLINKLSKFKGGAPGFVGRARLMRDVRQGTITRAAAIVAADTYNKQRRNPLPPL